MLNNHRLLQNISYHYYYYYILAWEKLYMVKLVFFSYKLYLYKSFKNIDQMFNACQQEVNLAYTKKKEKKKALRFHSSYTDRQL